MELCKDQQENNFSTISNVRTMETGSQAEVIRRYGFISSTTDALSACHLIFNLERNTNQSSQTIATQITGKESFLSLLTYTCSCAKTSMSAIRAWQNKNLVKRGRFALLLSLMHSHYGLLLVPIDSIDYVNAIGNLYTLCGQSPYDVR